MTFTFTGHARRMLKVRGISERTALFIAMYGEDVSRAPVLGLHRRTHGGVTVVYKLPARTIETVVREVKVN